jgi:selT/selW/selH-like putative selenoprotein
LAAELEQAVGAETELVVGGRGMFDVEADGKLIFSRHREGRFPTPGEIISALKG